MKNIQSRTRKFTKTEYVRGHLHVKESNKYARVTKPPHYADSAIDPIDTTLAAPNLDP